MQHWDIQKLRSAVTQLRPIVEALQVLNPDPEQDGQLEQWQQYIGLIGAFRLARNMLFEAHGQYVKPLKTERDALAACANEDLIQVATQLQKMCDTRDDEYDAMGHRDVVLEMKRRIKVMEDAAQAKQVSDDRSRFDDNLYPDGISMIPSDVNTRPTVAGAHFRGLQRTRARQGSLEPEVCDPSYQTMKAPVAACQPPVFALPEVVAA